MAQPKNLAPNLWIVDQPDFGSGPARGIGTRMTVIKLAGGGLFLHSPIKLDDETKRALDALGEVRAVVAPSRAHHLFVGDYVKTWPAAKLYGPPGLVGDIKDFRARVFGARTDLKLDATLGDDPLPEWAGEIDQHLFRGATGLNEVVFFHRTSRTAIFTDLVFNVPADFKDAWLFYTIVGGRGHFGPHRLIRLMIRDRKAARESVAKILEWDFDRVIVTHGDVLESGGKAKFAAAFSYL
jgi:Domain of unknown function (DUF4336)